MLLPRRSALLTATTGAMLVLAGCGGDGAASTAEDERLNVVASFYPLQYAAERVGGDAVTVENLTKPGAEPHDLELTPSDVGTISQADLVVFVHGFQPAVDEAVETEAGDAAYDVEQDADLDLAERLAGIDAANAQAYRDNAADLRSDLETLDEEMTTGLGSRTRAELVTSHTAFGYLAERHGFEQVGLTGLSPESEPSPQDVAEVIRFVQKHDVSTIYYETLVSPAVAETVTQETGATTAVLDPLEGLDDASAGEDYREVMRANLATLRAGQGCA